MEDRAVTMLINSRVAAQSPTSVYRNGTALDLGSLPDKALEETTNEDREFVASVIGTMTSWPWVGASLATKTLHKKRPALTITTALLPSSRPREPWDRCAGSPR